MDDAAGTGVAAVDGAAPGAGAQGPGGAKASQRWTRDDRNTFFDHFAISGDVARAAAAAGKTARSAYRQSATFVMNAATSARIRKFRTGDGQFLWQPGLVAGQPATLLGYPVVEAEDMPDVAAGAHAVAFGNFRLGYLIAERTETNVLRDPYSNKPFVTFYATRRVGGCVSNSEAIKLLRFAAA